MSTNKTINGDALATALFKDGGRRTEEQGQETNSSALHEVRIAQFMKTHKGAGTAIIMVLQMADRPLNRQELREMTGYGRDSIRDAIRLLVKHGVVVDVGDGRWTLPTTPQTSEVLTYYTVNPTTAKTSEVSSQPVDNFTTVAEKIGTRKTTNAKKSHHAEKIAVQNEPNAKKSAKSAIISHSDPQNALTYVCMYDHINPKKEINHTYIHGEGEGKRTESEGEEILSSALNPSSALSIVLEEIGITGPNFHRLLKKHDLTVEIVFDQWLYISQQPNIKSLHGLLMSILRGNTPKRTKYYGLAAVWLGMAGVDKDELKAIALGSVGEEGQIETWPCRNVAELVNRTEHLSDIYSGLLPEVLAVYLQMVQGRDVKCVLDDFWERIEV